MTTRPREQAVAREVIVAALQRDGFCDFNWIMPCLATGAW